MMDQFEKKNVDKSLWVLLDWEWHSSCLQQCTFHHSSFLLTVTGLLLSIHQSGWAYCTKVSIYVKHSVHKLKLVKKDYIFLCYWEIAWWISFEWHSKISSVIRSKLLLEWVIISGTHLAVVIWVVLVFRNKNKRLVGLYSPLIVGIVTDLVWSPSMVNTYHHYLIRKNSH